MVHCSGGAQTKILHFVEKLHIIKTIYFQCHHFSIDTRAIKTDWKEMYQVFNCGHRMEIYVPKLLHKTLSRFQNRLMSMQIVGRVEAATSKKLTITSEYGTFEY
jgi:phosphoribosylformylglycinamidine cyclo-ligase